MKKLLLGILLSMVPILIGCQGGEGRSDPTLPPAKDAETAILPAILPTVTTTQTQDELGLSGYDFPASIDPAQRYLFYLHGKIIEDQGLPAVSPEYGEYQYGAILEVFQGYGFIVISEKRPRDTEAASYARVITAQLTTLLDAGVSPENITVVGASKGAGITIYVSNMLGVDEVNYVILGICHPDVVADLIHAGITLSGNVLSVYDQSDAWAGSCEGLFTYSQDKGLSTSAEIVLEVGTGHGILYQPLEEWILPTVAWANGVAP